ncbi:MAG: hypothetical protein ACOX8K_10360 [Lachnospiraceae bacterium]|jgi:hypothetical protein
MKQKEKRGIIRLFPICVLLIILGAALNFWGGEKNPLLEKSGVQTFYLTIAPGEELNLRASEYFEEGILDENRISYDTSRCNTKQPGTYVVPVFYDGEETNCIFQVTVEENGKNLQILQKPGTDKNTEEIRISD